MQQAMPCGEFWLPSGVPRAQADGPLTPPPKECSEPRNLLVGVHVDMKKEEKPFRATGSWELICVTMTSLKASLVSCRLQFFHSFFFYFLFFVNECASFALGPK